MYANILPCKEVEAKLLQDFMDLDKDHFCTYLNIYRNNTNVNINLAFLCTENMEIHGRRSVDSSL